MGYVKFNISSLSPNGILVDKTLESIIDLHVIILDIDICNVNQFSETCITNNCVVFSSAS